MTTVNDGFLSSFMSVLKIDLTFINGIVDRKMGVSLVDMLLN